MAGWKTKQRLKKNAGSTDALKIREHSNNAHIFYKFNKYNYYTSKDLASSAKITPNQMAQNSLISQNYAIRFKDSFPPSKIPPRGITATFFMPLSN